MILYLLMIDLHTHSSFSDGDLSPQTLINEAVKLGLRAIALTDHDTIKGLESAKTAAALITDNKSDENGKFHLIPGIEININWTKAPCIGSGGEFHLLGLGIRSPSQAFISAVNILAHRREMRNREILDRMVELSLIDQADQESVWNELCAISGGNSLGRPHFAAFMVKRKISRNVKQAFSRYLAVGKPLYAHKEGLPFEEAAALIRESGGIAVLAHPLSLYIAWGRLPDMIKILKDMGLMGIEAWHPIAKRGSCRRLEALAKSLNLYVTEGSDYHGAFRADTRLGYSNKGRKINDNVLEAIPELAAD